MTTTAAEPVDFWADAETISTYTRADAIRDGVLIDVTADATEAGIRWPMALTAAAHADLVAWPTDNHLQDESGRLWDVVHLTRAFGLKQAIDLIQRTGQPGQRVDVPIYRVPVGSRSGKPRKTLMSVHVGPGDTGEPVITVMLPSED